jgi:hypothetical protein
VDTSVASFIEVARGYCALVEVGGSGNSWLFARECLASVLDLYRAALVLPETEPDGLKLTAPIGHELWEATRRRLQEKLSRDTYWEIFEPMQLEQPEPLCGSLSDDLADIWRDVKEGLLISSNEDASSTDEAVWRWRFSLESHWAHDASGAIYALHALCFGPFADLDRPTSAETEP